MHIDTLVTAARSSTAASIDGAPAPSLVARHARWLPAAVILFAMVAALLASAHAVVMSLS